MSTEPSPVLMTRAPGARTLADLYDADLRTRDETTRRLAAMLPVPHPLNNVRYADGVSPCRHSRRHDRWEPCRQEVRPA